MYISVPEPEAARTHPPPPPPHRRSPHSSHPQLRDGLDRPPRVSGVSDPAVSSITKESIAQAHMPTHLPALTRALFGLHLLLRSVQPGPPFTLLCFHCPASTASVSTLSPA
ncbi:hypothetical protein COCCADRAFT_108536 [Bipolaris zeicola 26-R-13]|uniref:Uncharacterized protein n=1 Tax=Cochliobolus carbonum (strain 26-R-13) TaxID=930089 RepID=W6XU74_COCC2|nr:uncharacterized protein COCCADRAFT_108536 [Bipolaris zeicola 26-R-13]EUC28670.1 hypothetical protein COCCADRAFT_108536 [Bipolaris zeicola 26-R-13]